MIALMYFLWFLAGALCSFLFLLAIHKFSHSRIDPGDQVIAFLIFVCFPFGLFIGAVAAIMLIMHYIVDFIEEKF